MTFNGRKLSPIEQEAKYAAQIFELNGQGYRVAEIARMLSLTPRQVKAISERVAKRNSMTDLKHWRQVQLLSLERLKQSCLAVLESHHVVVSNGMIVREVALGDDGKPIWDPVYGPDGEQLQDEHGRPRVETRKVPLSDHGAVLEAAAELRKIEAEIMKLLGTATVVKQEVEVQHVNYTINGVDLSKVIGANRAGADTSEGKTDG